MDDLQTKLPPVEPNIPVREVAVRLVSVCLTSQPQFSSLETCLQPGGLFRCWISASQMEPLTYVVDRVKDFGKAGHIFIDGILHRVEESARRNPIEILKRLQREAFSDLMKLRDRQDKVETVISLFKPTKGSPFKESSTRVRGEVDLLGALLMIDNVDQHSGDALNRAGIRTGIKSRLSFETAVGENDTLVTEFVASQQDNGHTNDFSGSKLSLAKVFYRASISDWISAVVAPLGAQCRDVAVTTSLAFQGKGLTDISSLGPPILSQLNGSAIGLSVRKSNVLASLSQFVSGYDDIRCCFGTFGQVVLRFPKGTSLSLLGLLQVPKSSPSSQRTHLGPLAVPIFFSNHVNAPVEEASAPPVLTNTWETRSSQHIALVFETELDEVTRLGGWVEMSKSHDKHIQWAMLLCDDSEDMCGWGMSLSGTIGSIEGRFQAESYLKLNLGKNSSLKPGIAFVSEGNTRFTALMLRSNWSL